MSVARFRLGSTSEGHTAWIPGRKVKFGPGVRGRTPPTLPGCIDLPVTQPAGTASFVLFWPSQVCADCGSVAVPRLRYILCLSILPPPLRSCLALPCHAMPCMRVTALQGSTDSNQNKLSLRGRQASQSGNLKGPMNIRIQSVTTHYCVLPDYLEQYGYAVLESESRGLPSPYPKLRGPAIGNRSQFHMQA